MTGLREVSSSNRRSVMVRIMKSRFQVLPQLSEWLEGVLDQSATADCNACLLHSDWYLGGSHHPADPLTFNFQLTCIAAEASQRNFTPYASSR